MNPAGPENEIVIRSSSRLTHAASGSLARRGLTDLESSEKADEWLAKAEEHFSKETNALTSIGKGRGGWSIRKLSVWHKSDEHRSIMAAYFDCLRQAVAVKPNYSKALIELAIAYFHGWGVTESRDEALRLWRLATASASPDERWKITWRIKCAFTGLDPWPEGMEEYLKMCREAAERGNAGAKYNIAKMYVKGEGGLPCDDDLALYWFRKAAENGEFPPAEGQLQYWKSKKSTKSSTSG